MGTNCAPALANLYLYSYESRFIDRLIEENKHETAEKFHMTFRLIDDVLSIDNDAWHTTTAAHSNEDGIYPQALSLNDTTLHNGAHFLGMTITTSDDEVLVDVFDKTHEFPFHVIKYPNMHSLIPSYIPYNVFTGQLYRFFRICTKFDSFVDHAISLALIMLERGCKKHVLCKRMKSFLFNNLSQQDRKRYGTTALYQLFTALSLHEEDL